MKWHLSKLYWSLKQVPVIIYKKEVCIDPQLECSCKFTPLFQKWLTRWMSGDRTENEISMDALAA